MSFITTFTFLNIYFFSISALSQPTHNVNIPFGDIYMQKMILREVNEFRSNPLKYKDTIVKYYDEVMCEATQHMPYNYDMGYVHAIKGIDSIYCNLRPLSNDNNFGFKTSFSSRKASLYMVTSFVRPKDSTDLTIISKKLVTDFLIDMGSPDREYFHVISSPFYKKCEVRVFILDPSKILNSSYVHMSIQMSFR